jgi:N-acetyl sugar amidotransferase
VRYCARCVLPDTRPGLTLDAQGVCDACRSHEKRLAVDWTARERDFRSLVAEVKAASTGYDCVIPVSGGKDSTWQVVTCLEHGLKPLAVTWRPPARTEIGQRNLDNLIGLGVDHVDFSIDPRIERRFMLRAFERHGSTAIPMHMALFSIPLTLAVRQAVPLVVWGENSAVEYGGEEALKGHRLDNAWLRRFGVTQGTTWEDWLSPELTSQDLTPYKGPTDAEMHAAGVRAVFLGHYFAWDPETSLRVAEEHGFRRRPEGPLTGIYDYADIDDDLIALHHWMKWYKFGFTRAFDNLSLEIRNGRISRDGAIATLARLGPQRPDEGIGRFCRFVGITEARFDEIAETFRNTAIWKRDGGRWTIPGFLVPGGRWT